MQLEQVFLSYFFVGEGIVRIAICCHVVQLGINFLLVFGDFIVIDKHVFCTFGG